MMTQIDNVPHFQDQCFADLAQNFDSITDARCSWKFDHEARQYITSADPIDKSTNRMCSIIKLPG